MTGLNKKKQLKKAFVDLSSGNESCAEFLTKLSNDRFLHDDDR